MNRLDVVPRTALAAVTAWTMIVTAGFATALGAVVAVATAVLYARLPVSEALADGRTPPWIATFVEILPWLSAWLTVASAAVLAVSIGFLQRRRWARAPFLVILALTALAHVVAPIALFPAVDALPATVSLGGAETIDLRSVARPVLVINLIGSVAMAALIAWITIRLASTEARRESERRADRAVGGESRPQ